MHEPDLRIGVSQLLVRPLRMDVESPLEYGLRLAHVNGITQATWIFQPNQRAVPLRLCPLCLAEEQRWSKEWQQTSVPICRLHWIWFVDVCVECGASLAWPRTRLMHCHCGADLAQIPVQPVAQSLRLFLGLDSNVSIEALRWLGAWFLHGPTGKPLKKASYKSLAQQQTLLTEGAVIAANWPHAFEKALRQHRQPSEPHEIQRLIQAWPGLPVQISRLADPSWQEEIWSAVNRFVEGSHQSTKPIIGRNRNLQRRARTRREIANTLGVGIARLKATIFEIAAQVPTRHSRAGRTRQVISMETEQVLKRALNEWISVRESALLLGCGRMRIAAMVKDSLLESRAGKLHRSSVNLIRDQLLAMAKTLPAETETHPLDHVWRYLVPKAMSKKFLEAIFDGRIRVCSVPGSQGWHGIHVHSEDIEAWTIAEISSSTRSLSLSEVAVALKIKEQVAYDLAKRGFLKTVNDDGTGRRVTQETILKFSEQYFALSNLTRKKGVHSHDALDWALAQGLNVVTGPRIDGGRQYFIRQREAC
ncbi:hypothetical protein MCEMSEM18_00217 [Comamonadaceae bacterium]